MGLVSAGRRLSTRSASAASLQPLLFLLTPRVKEVVQHWGGKIDYFKVLKAVAFRSSNWGISEFPSGLTGPGTS